MANLIVPDPEDTTQVMCINRTDMVRAFPKTYPKRDMLAWESMASGEVKYEPYFKTSKPKPYRSILCLPLLRYDKDGESTKGKVLGAVTIDHCVEHEFDGLIERLKIILSPYLRLLELSLVKREKLPGIGPNVPKQTRRRRK